MRRRSVQKWQLVAVNATEGWITAIGLDYEGNEVASVLLDHHFKEDGVTNYADINITMRSHIRPVPIVVDGSELEFVEEVA